MKNNLPKNYVGVDVSKASLAIYIHPAGESFDVENSEKGFQEMLKKLAKYEIGLIVFESTGGYENQLREVFVKAQYRYWHVNPVRVKAFITSEGIKVKTDKMDAKMLALFAAEKKQGYEHYIRTESEKHVRELTARKNELIKALVAEKNRYQNPRYQISKPEILDHINYLEAKIKAIKLQLKGLISADSSMQKKLELLTSIPGIGQVAAEALISEVPEFGSVTNKKAAAIIGVAPYQKESGTLKSHSIIKGGRPLPRRILYMAALSATRFNDVLKTFYQRLRKAGKKPKVAIVAVMRKLVVYANEMLRKGESWKPAKI